VTLSVAKGFGFGGKVMNEKGLFVEWGLQTTAEVHEGKHVPLSLFQLQIPLASVVRGRRLAARPSQQGCCS
jgi:hypothetical protein